MQTIASILSKFAIAVLGAGLTFMLIARCFPALAKGLWLGFREFQKAAHDVINEIDHDDDDGPTSSAI